MRREPVWLVKSVVLALHDEQIAEHGGADGLRTEGELDSALARPRQAFASGEPSLFEMAAALAFGLSRNHPFVDGNKRTSLVAAELFLDLNGFALLATDEELVAAWTALADRSLLESEPAKWLESRCRPAGRETRTK